MTTQDEVLFAKIFAMAFGMSNGWNSGAGNHCGTAVLIMLAALFSLLGDLSIIYCIAKAGLYRPLPG